MEDDKWNYPFASYEDRLQHYWSRVVESMEKVRPEYSMALLIKSVERLKASTDKNLEGLMDLKASMEKSSSEANRLSAAIKKLTGWLVGLTIAAVVLAAVSFFVLWKSIK